MTTLIALITGIIYAEIVGYFVHILIHSEKFPALSNAHMLHHLRDYGPHKKYFTEKYIESTRDRASFYGGIGFEWFVPIGTILGITVAILYTAGVSAYFQAVFVITGLVWGYTAFSYMHSAMHLKNFWMLKVPGLKQWCQSLRTLHLIHHKNVFEDGRMMTNFGICFFWFDRLFGTYAKKVICDSPKGFKAAEKRYSYIYE